MDGWESSEATEKRAIYLHPMSNLAHNAHTHSTTNTLLRGCDRKLKDEHKVIWTVSCSFYPRWWLEIGWCWSLSSGWWWNHFLSLQLERLSLNTGYQDVFYTCMLFWKQVFECIPEFTFTETSDDTFIFVVARRYISLCPYIHSLDFLAATCNILLNFFSLCNSNFQPKHFSCGILWFYFKHRAVMF